MDYWAKARNDGFFWFALRRGTALGLVMFGVLVIVPRLFGMVATDGYPVMPFIGFMGLGYAFSGLLWLANQRSYNRSIAANPDARADSDKD